MNTLIGLIGQTEAKLCKRDRLLSRLLRHLIEGITLSKEKVFHSARILANKKEAERHRPDLVV